MSNVLLQWGKGNEKLGKIPKAFKGPERSKWIECLPPLQPGNWQTRKAPGDSVPLTLMFSGNQATPAVIKNHFFLWRTKNIENIILKVEK
jgi:hypothetical protein